MKQDSLGAAIDAGRQLTPAEIEGCMLVLAPHCRAATREKLARRFALPLSLWPNHSRFYRLHFDNARVSYCAGQDYPSEIAELRALILKGF